MTSNHFVGIRLGVPESKINNSKRLAYASGPSIPMNFVVENVIVRVIRGVKNKKIDIGIASDTKYFVSGLDVSDPGIKVPGRIMDKKGETLKVTLGSGLCNVVTVDAPSSTGKSTVSKIVAFEKILCTNISGETVYITIPKGCGKENPDGALKIAVTITGYRV